MTTFPALRPRLVGFWLAVAGVAASTLGLMATVSAAAIPAGTPPTNGLSGLVLNPSSGDSGTTFAMQLDPANQPCPGNNNSGFSWSTFITPVAQDPALLTFSPSGMPEATATGRTTAFRNTDDEFVRGEFPDLDTFTIIPPDFLSFDTTFSRNPAIEDGSYYVGIACYNASDLANAKYWATRITLTNSAGAGPWNFTWQTEEVVDDTTTTTHPDDSTTTTDPDGATTTTDPDGATSTSSTVVGNTPGATVTPSSPPPGGSYKVDFPECQAGETITFAQPDSTPKSVTATCAALSALDTTSASGFRRPAQLTTGTASASFTAAPTATGTYTVTMTGTVSSQRTVTFTVTAATSNVQNGISAASTSSGGATGTLADTGGSPMTPILWAIALLVSGRFAILLGRKPRVL